MKENELVFFIVCLSDSSFVIILFYLMPCKYSTLNISGVIHKLNSCSYNTTSCDRKLDILIIMNAVD